VHAVAVSWFLASRARTDRAVLEERGRYRACQVHDLLSLVERHVGVDAEQPLSSLVDHRMVVGRHAWKDHLHEVTYNRIRLVFGVQRLSRDVTCSAWTTSLRVT
jgi:hypothetical protein